MSAKKAFYLYCNHGSAVSIDVHSVTIYPRHYCAYMNEDDSRKNACVRINIKPNISTTSPFLSDQSIYVKQPSKFLYP